MILGISRSTNRYLTSYGIDYNLTHPDLRSSEKTGDHEIAMDADKEVKD